MDVLKVLIEFVITFLIVYAFYYFFVIKRCKKEKKLAPAEVNIILEMYHIDYKKINLIQMIRVVSLVTTLIISLIITLISMFFDSTIIVLLFGTTMSILVAIICYQAIGHYYKKISDSKDKKSK